MFPGANRRNGAFAAALALVVVVALGSHYWWWTSVNMVGPVSQKQVEAPSTQHPDHLPFDAQDGMPLSLQLFNYIETPTVWCRRLSMFGGVCTGSGKVDGDKFVCLDAEYAPTAGACLVYSFGIAHEWSFDKDVTGYGCQVHAFDPSMETYPEGKTAFGVHFYRTGLGTKTKNTPIKWRMMSLTQIRANLSHTQRVIDYLKVDIEGSEWDWLDDDVNSLKSVRQLGMEIHMNEASLARYHNAFRQIHALGFRLAHSSPNRVYGRTETVQGVRRKVALLYELVWLNRHKL
ncbi:methyltransferase-like protein 24 [Pollicipes pollicipes]|uniref:methyltransferase-like protein 24 n=1 Tax=Pollicipes pollicipes TaxID=41117 RepID=UPI001884B6EF|nr:methyltransferase-like protein 24 [Pollicipes pollicipes]